MKKISPRDIKENAIEMIESRWMLITAGNMDNFNMMTANWGALGELWFKDVAFIFVRPQRYTYEFIEKNEMMTISFFGEEHRAALKLCGRVSGRDVDKVAETGLTPYKTETGSVAFREAEVMLECRKLYADVIDSEAVLDKTLLDKVYPTKDYHRMYVVEIVSAWIKE